MSSNLEMLEAQAIEMRAIQQLIDRSKAAKQLESHIRDAMGLVGYLEASRLFNEDLEPVLRFAECVQNATHKDILALRELE